MLIFHIIGAGAWLGANVIQAVVPSLVTREGAAPTAAWYRIAAQFGKKLYGPAALLIVASGVVLVLGDEAIGFGTLFVTIGLGMVVVGALLGSLVFDRGSKEAAEVIESGDQGRFKQTASKLAAWGTVDTLLLLFTITAMVLRWGDLSLVGGIGFPNPNRHPCEVTANALDSVLPRSSGRTALRPWLQGSWWTTDPIRSSIQGLDAEERAEQIRCRLAADTR